MFLQKIFLFRVWKYTVKTIVKWPICTYHSNWKQKEMHCTMDFWTSLLCTWRTQSRRWWPYSGRMEYCLIMSICCIWTGMGPDFLQLLQLHCFCILVLCDWVHGKLIFFVNFHIFSHNLYTSWTQISCSKVVMHRTCEFYFSECNFTFRLRLGKSWLIIFRKMSFFEGKKCDFILFTVI